MQSRLSTRWLLMIGIGSGCATAPIAKPQPEPAPVAKPTPRAELSPIPKQMTAGEPEPRMRLARARIAAAGKNAYVVKLRFDRGGASVAEYLASRLLCFDAVRDSPVRGPEREQAASDYRDSVLQLAESMRGKVASGNMGVGDLAPVEYRLAEAEYWLAEIRGRNEALSARPVAAAQ